MINRNASVYLRGSGRFELGALKEAIKSLEARGVSDTDLLTILWPRYDLVRGRWVPEFFSIIATVATAESVDLPEQSKH